MPFMFQRRFIQRCLDRLAAVLSEAARQELIRKLNRRDDSRLAAMWEAVLLPCFIDLEDFEHEKPLDDGRQPDIRCRLRKSGALLVGDITSVSDKGYHKDNPIDHFISELDRIAKKQGSDLSQFHVQVDSINDGPYDRRKIRLLIPRGQELGKFLKREVKPYIAERLKLCDYGYKKLFRTEDYSVEIEFKERSNYASWGHPVFTGPLHIDRNPVWKRLTDKADQLKAAPKDALRFVILCDGGASSMNENGFNQKPGRREIVNGFLLRHQSIDLVVAVTTSSERDNFGHRREKFSIVRSVRPGWLESCSNSNAVMDEFADVVDQYVQDWPAPSSNAQSAANSVKNMDYGIGAWGGCEMGGDVKLEMSARAIQRLLAGDVSVEEFNDAHGWDGENPFARALKNGRSISSVRVSKRDQHDDDLVEFTFAEDAGLGPFK